METTAQNLTLSFDKGTLLLRGGGMNAIPALEHFVWDERVGALRGQASFYADVLKNYQAKLPIDDQVKRLVGGQVSWQKIALRPYQEAAVLSWEANGRRGLIGLPTGAGKTRLALAAISAANVATLVLVPTRVLLEQWENDIREFYQGPIGVIGDGKRRIESLTVCTFESAYRNMTWLGNRFQMIVVDEAHHFGRGLKDEALLMAIAPYRLGLTATRPDDKEQLANLNELVGPLVYELSVNDLSGRFLAEFQLLRIPLHLNTVERLRYEREYCLFKNFYRGFMANNPQGTWQEFNKLAASCEHGRRALAAFFRSRRIISLTSAKSKALEKILTRHYGQKKLIFTADTGSAFKVSREFLIPVITGEIGRKERSAILSDFREGRVMSIVACRVLNEGVDVPDAEVAVILGGTANGREHVQRIGRLLRPSVGKKAIVYELFSVDTYEERHSNERGKPLARARTSSLRRKSNVFGSGGGN